MMPESIGIIGNMQGVKASARPAEELGVWRQSCLARPGRLASSAHSSRPLDPAKDEASTARDAALVALHQLYPQYGFDQHKGYGTALHMEVLRRLGPTPEHRRSFRPVARAC